MSLNDGFVIIGIKDGIIDYYPVISGSIDYSPEIAWKIEKQSSFNPEVVIRKHSYHQDKIDIEVILTPDEYHHIVDFITNSDQLYIEYFCNEIKRQYPVTIDKMPKQDDDGRRYNNKYKFQFTSIYTIYTVIDFDTAFGFGNNYGLLWGF